MAGSERVAELVNELHQVLEDASELDDSARDALRTAAGEIREALEGDEDEGALGALKDRLERFEGDHPTLTEAVRRLVDQLADMGI